MPDPILKKTGCTISYTASDGYRYSFEAKGGEGTGKRTLTGEDVAPEKALLEPLEELARIVTLFGFGDEAKRLFERAQKNVADWRAALKPKDPQ